MKPVVLLSLIFVLLQPRGWAQAPNSEPPHPATAPASPYPPGMELVEVLQLGIERPGVRIELVCEPGMSPRELGTGVFVHQGNTAKLVRGPQDLLGTVRITSDTDALKFARLGTMYLDGFAGIPNGLEVLPESRTADILRYGISSEQRRGKGVYSYSGHSGWVGILSDEAFRVGGFEEPKVTGQHGIWSIERWIWAPFGPSPDVRRVEGGMVLHIRETVGANGLYTRFILSSRTPPVLPATHWRVPTLM
jgi:hypothetical protein